MTFKSLLRPGYAAVLALVLAVPATRAALGDLETTINVQATCFAVDQSRQLLYASNFSGNSVAVIDMQTLKLLRTVPVGIQPEGLAVSPDGSRVYVADSGENKISVIDTSNFSALPALVTPIPVRQVASGNSGRLYCSTDNYNQNTMLQINAFTDDATLYDMHIYADAVFQMSSDRNTLFVGIRGLAGVVKLDVSTPIAQQLAGHQPSGANGRDLQLSHDGKTLVYPCGGGNDGTYSITKYLVTATDSVAAGDFNTNTYPGFAAFSPDDNLLYTSLDGPKVDIFDVSTLALVGQFMPSGGGLGALVVNDSGHDLFASQSSGISVFDTGRSVAAPEPAYFATLALSFGLLLRRSRMQCERCPAVDWM